MGWILPVLGAVSAIASLKGSSNNRKAAETNAKAAANTTSTTEEIIHRPPIDFGAMGVQGYDMAQQWAALMEMVRQAAGSDLMPGMGFEPGAGQGALSAFDQVSSVGDDGRESEYAGYEVLRKAKQALEVKLKYLGIDNGMGTNPSGVKMTLQEFIQLRLANDPSGMVSKGLSMSDPVQEEEFVSVAGRMGIPENAVRVVSMLADDLQLAGKESMDALAGDPKHAEGIAYLKTQGVIRTDGMVNQGQLKKHASKLVEATVANRSSAPETPEMLATLTDEFTRLSGKVMDPKLVKQEHIGDGLVRTRILNSDGTPAVSLLEGSVSLPNGQVLRDVDLIGEGVQDWKKLQQMVGNTGSMFEQSSPTPTPESPAKAKKPAKPAGAEGMADLSTGGASPGGAATATGGEGDLVAQIAALLGGSAGAPGAAPTSADTLDPTGMPGYDTGKPTGMPNSFGVADLGGGNMADPAMDPFGMMAGQPEEENQMAGMEADGTGGGQDMEQMMGMLMKNPKMMQLLLMMMMQNQKKPAGYSGSPLAAGG